MVNIIPKPAKAQELNEKIWFSKKTEFCGEFAQTAKTFEHLIPDAVEAQANVFTFIKDADIEAEGYKILYSDGNVNVFCSDAAGALYAFMSVVQLAGGKDSFNAVIIEDKPKCSWRGFMLDCSRHFWTVKKIKKTLDYMATIKMNIFHWHLCDDQGWRIEIKKYPVLTEKGSVRCGTSKSPYQAYYGDPEHYEPIEYGKGLYYTQEDAREIINYAAERNITVVPEIDVPGHASAIIACMPELSCTGKEREVAPTFGILDNVLCCAKPKVYEVLKDIITELCELFPAPYFHLGGDEVVPDAWNNCPDCQKLMKENGLETPVELHGYFNEIIIEHIKSCGKCPIGWNDMLTPNLGTDIISQLWTFEIPDNVFEWVSRGGKAIITSGIYMYGDYPYARLPLSTTYNFNGEIMKIDSSDSILGYEVPLWCEYIKTEDKFDFQIHTRMMAVAEKGWTEPEKRNFEDFELRMHNHREFFAKLGVAIPSKRIYEGLTFNGAEDMIFFDRKEEGFRRHWYRDTDFEFNQYLAEKGRVI